MGATSLGVDQILFHLEGGYSWHGSDDSLGCQGPTRLTMQGIVLPQDYVSIQPLSFSLVRV